MPFEILLTEEVSHERRMLEKRKADLKEEKRLRIQARFQRRLMGFDVAMDGDGGDDDDDDDEYDEEVQMNEVLNSQKDAITGLFKIVDIKMYAFEGDEDSNEDSDRLLQLKKEVLDRARKRRENVMTAQKHTSGGDPTIAYLRKVMFSNSKKRSGDDDERDKMLIFVDSEVVDEDAVEFVAEQKEIAGIMRCVEAEERSKAVALPDLKRLRHKKKSDSVTRATASSRELLDLARICNVSNLVKSLDATETVAWAGNRAAAAGRNEGALARLSAELLRGRAGGSQSTISEDKQQQHRQEDGYVSLQSRLDALEVSLLPTPTPDVSRAAPNPISGEASLASSRAAPMRPAGSRLPPSSSPIRRALTRAAPPTVIYAASPLPCSGVNKQVNPGPAAELCAAATVPLRDVELVEAIERRRRKEDAGISVSYDEIKGGILDISTLAFDVSALEEEPHSLAWLRSQRRINNKKSLQLAQAYSKSISAALDRTSVFVEGVVERVKKSAEEHSIAMDELHCREFLRPYRLQQYYLELTTCVDVEPVAAAACPRPDDEEQSTFITAAQHPARRSKKGSGSPRIHREQGADPLASAWYVSLLQSLKQTVRKLEAAAAAAAAADTSADPPPEVLPPSSFLLLSAVRELLKVGLQLRQEDVFLLILRCVPSDDHGSSPLYSLIRELLDAHGVSIRHYQQFLDEAYGGGSARSPRFISELRQLQRSLAQEGCS